MAAATSTSSYLCPLRYLLTHRSLPVDLHFILELAEVSAAVHGPHPDPHVNRGTSSAPAPTSGGSPRPLPGGEGAGGGKQCAGGGGLADCGGARGAGQ